MAHVAEEGLRIDVDEHVILQVTSTCKLAATLFAAKGLLSTVD